MQPARRLRDRIEAGDLVTGALITNHLWLELIEIAIDAGLDYAIIDCEHMRHDGQTIVDACRLGRLAEFPILIRPPRTDREAVREAADAGACGVLLPMVESVGQLEDAVAGALMPPRGDRRPGGHGNWWVDDYQYETWRDEFEANWIVLPQVESLPGLACCVELARSPLTTALAVGPYDLSARLGVCFKPDDERFQDALKQLRAAAANAGKPMWMIGDGPDLVRRGFRFLCIAEPANLLRATMKDLVQRTRSAE